MQYLPNFSLLLSKLCFLLIKIFKNPKKTQNFTKNMYVDYKKMVIDIDKHFLHLLGFSNN